MPLPLGTALAACAGADARPPPAQGPLPLTEIAGLLMERCVSEHDKSQTQITVERRLYDIGSILTSVGLIEKTYMGKRYRPACA